LSREPVDPLLSGHMLNRLASDRISGETARAASTLERRGCPLIDAADKLVDLDRQIQERKLWSSAKSNMMSAVSHSP
jgi:hypothetical protein